MWFRIMAAALAVSLSVSACAPAVKDYREQYVQAHPDLDPRIREAILHGDAAVGMTREQVMASCGPPHLATRGLEAGATCDYWAYQKFMGYKGFTVTYGPDGKVTGVK